MNGLIAVFRRELAAYFETPLAWVFLTVFSFAAPSFAWRLGRMFDTARADLSPFFAYLPWLLLILMPAIAMRTWAEERDRGTLEGLLASPISVRAAALGKFLAAWCVAGLALIATFPLWIAMSVLGEPDHAAIATAYLGAFVLAGGYLAIGQALSALTQNQVIAFVLGVVAAFLITIAGVPFVVDALANTLSGAVAEALAELSALSRFEALGRGVIHLTDLVYFLSLIGLGLGLAVVLIDAQRRLVAHGWRFIVIMAAGLILGFAGLNLLAASLASGVRLDLTERQLYRLSPGSRDILARMDEPIRLDFYYSRREAAQYPAVRTYGARVRGLLRTLADQSGGQIVLTEIDPAPFSPDEDAAIAAGLQPLPSEQGGQIFFGLVGQNAVDDREVIAAFDPLREARLEFEILRAIAALERAAKPNIAIISSLPFEPDFEGRSANPVIQDLSASFEISWLDPDFETIPAEADAVLLLHPNPLSQDQTYLIDQFMVTKGRLLALIDPMAHIALKPGPDGLPPIDAQRASRLDRLLGQWGVFYDPNTVIMDGQTGLPVQIVEAGRTRTRAYPLWFSVTETGMNGELPAVSGLSRGINVGSPGVLDFPDETAGSEPLSYQPILQTSAVAARIDADEAASSPSPETLMRLLEPAEDAPLTLGVIVSGMFSSTFPDGPPAGDIAFTSAHVSQGDNPGEVIVIADADLLDPVFYLSNDPVSGAQLVADNLNLISNLADRLAGDPALISLRSLSASHRPMTLVDELRSEAETRYLTLQDQLRTELSTAELDLAQLTEAGRASALGGADSTDSDEADTLRAQILNARERLREIERGFRIDIDRLERGLMIWTVWVPPLTIIMIGFALMIWRRRQTP